MDIKELLYNRLNDLKSRIKTNADIVPYDPFEGGCLSGETSQYEDEIDFITNLLDTIERS